MIHLLLINSGTFTIAPVDKVAGFEPPVAVSPLSPGSVSTMSKSTKFGATTRIGTSFHKVTVHRLFSFNHCIPSLTAFLSAAICSKLSSVFHEMPILAV